MRIRGRRTFGCEGWAHSESYRGLNPAAFVHRARLRRILRTLRGLKLPPAGRLADFGCSDGFILEHIRRELLPSDRWSLHGFDFNQKMLERAEARSIHQATFQYLNLNEAVPVATWGGGFDIVTCFESFEHMGDYQTGLMNILSSCRSGGQVVITVPNESGTPGLIKFFGRKLIQRSPYARFFPDASTERRYLWALASGGKLEPFRNPPRPSGWGEHLGFDVREFEVYLRANFVDQGAFDLLRRASISAGFGRLFVLRRLKRTQTEEPL